MKYTRDFSWEQKRIQWNLWVLDTLGPGILCFIGRLTSLWRLKWQKGESLGPPRGSYIWEGYFPLMCPLSEVLLYWIGGRCTGVTWHTDPLSSQSWLCPAFSGGFLEILSRRRFSCTTIKNFSSTRDFIMSIDLCDGCFMSVSPHQFLNWRWFDEHIHRIEICLSHADNTLPNKNIHHTILDYDEKCIVAAMPILSLVNASVSDTYLYVNVQDTYSSSWLHVPYRLLTATGVHTMH